MRLNGSISPLDRQLRATAAHVTARVLLSLGGLLLCCFPGQSKADTLQISVNEVKVFAAPNTSSDVVTTLFKGDVVPVSRNPVPGFRKVLIKDGSQKKIGYIRIADLNPVPPRNVRPAAGARSATAPYVQPQAKNQKRPQKVVRRVKTPHNRSVLGLLVGLNYQYQGSRNYTDSSGGNANIGVLSGTSFQVGAFFDFPLSYNFSLRAYGEYKSVSVTGTATYVPLNSQVTAAPTSTFLNETFLTVGVLGTIYPNARSNWWWGPGLQVDIGSSGTLQYGSLSAVALTGSSLPTFVFGYVAMGYNLMLGGSFVLIPDIRIGGILNALPIVMEADAHVNIGYMF